MKTAPLTCGAGILLRRHYACAYHAYTAMCLVEAMDATLPQVGSSHLAIDKAIVLCTILLHPEQGLRLCLVLLTGFNDFPKPRIPDVIHFLSL
jgi:hypothetical protein